MKNIILFRLIISFLFVNMYASNIDQKKICQQILTNVKVGGDVIMNCITYIDQQSFIEKKELEKLSRQLSIQSNDINVTIQQINSIKEKIYIHKKNFEKLRKMFKNAIATIKDNEETNIVINKKIKNIKNRFVLIEDMIQENKLSLKHLSNKVKNIEKDVAILMDAYYQGTLQDLSFWGVKLGSLITGKQHTLYIYLGLQYEMLLPKKYSSSWFIEALWFTGKKETKYNTLNGIEKSEKSKDDNIFSLGIGGKYFFLKNYYVGTSFAKTFVDETSFNLSLFSGHEYYFKNKKLLFEIGTTYFNNRKYENITFNPFGEATIEKKNEQWTIYLSVQLSFLYQKRKNR